MFARPAIVTCALSIIAFTPVLAMRMPPSKEYVPLSVKLKTVPEDPLMLRSFPPLTAVLLVKVADVLFPENVIFPP